MRTHQQDTEAVKETTDEGMPPPRREPTSDAQPDPLGSHPFARIIRSRKLARPESLYKRALRKVCLLVDVLRRSLITSSLNDLGSAGAFESRPGDVDDSSACRRKGPVQGSLNVD